MVRQKLNTNRDRCSHPVSWVTSACPTGKVLSARGDRAALELQCLDIVGAGVAFRDLQCRLMPESIEGRRPSRICIVDHTTKRKGRYGHTKLSDVH